MTGILSLLCSSYLHLNPRRAISLFVVMEPGKGQSSKSSARDVKVVTEMEWLSGLSMPLGSLVLV